jgi:hypothetical protein
MVYANQVQVNQRRGLVGCYGITIYREFNGDFGRSPWDRAKGM